MKYVNLVDKLKSVLTSEEYYALKDITSLYVGESLLIALKRFFTKEHIFKKIFTIAEPMWLVNIIYTNHHEIEF